MWNGRALATRHDPDCLQFNHRLMLGMLRALSQRGFARRHRPLVLSEGQGMTIHIKIRASPVALAFDWAGNPSPAATIIGYARRGGLNFRANPTGNGKYEFEADIPDEDLGKFIAVF